MSTVATLLVRVAGDTKDAEKAFAGLESAGKSLERAYSGLGTRLSGVGGDLAKGLGASLSGIESAAGKAFGALDQGLGKVGQALGPIANMLPGLPGPVQALAGAFSGFLPVAGVLGGVGVALGAIGGIAVGIVGGLVALGKSAADAGDAMLVLSQQSGISVENLSRFQYVSQQTDASVDKIVGSINKLGINLANGSKEASKAITSIGLSLADVKRLKPEDAFVAIVDGLGKIPGAGQRAAAGTAIFGKGWHEVSQLAAEDLRGLMHEADLFGATMTTELAVAGDRFNDTLGQLSTVVEGFTRAAGAGVLPVLTAVAEVLRDQVIKYLQATGTTAATTQATFETFAIKVALTMAQVSASVTRGIADIARLFANPIIGDSVVFRELQRFIRMVGVLNGIKLDTMDTVASGAQATADALTMAADQLDKDLPGALARVKAEIAAAAAAMKAGQTAAIGYGTATAAVDDKLQKLIDTMSGATVMAKARELMDVFAALTARGLKPSAEGLKSLTDAIKAAAAVAHSKGGQLAADMVALYQSIIPPARSLGDDLSKFANEIARFARGLVPSVKSNLKPMQAALLAAFQIPDPNLGGQVEQYLRKAALGDVVTRSLAGLKTNVTSILSSMFVGQTGFLDGFKAMFGALQSIAANVMNDILTTLEKELAKFFKGGGFDLKKLFAGDQVAGAIAGSAVGATVGAAMGTLFGQNFGKAAGIAMGAASGALSGAMVGMMAGPQAAAVAAIVGGTVGAVSGFLAAAGEEKKQRALMGTTRNELLATFGDQQHVTDLLARSGHTLSPWATDDPIQFAKVIETINSLLAKEKKLVEDLAKGLQETAVSGALLTKQQIKDIGANRGVPGHDEAVGAFMKTQQDAAIKGLDAFLSNAQVKTQAGATAISASIAGIYDTLIKSGAAPTEAFRQLEPLIAKFQAGLATTNATLDGTTLSGVAAFGPLAALAGIAADAIGGPVMDAMAGLGQGLTATANLGLLNQTTFGGFAAEALAGFKQLEALGKGGEVALAGMQGPLQKLWELSTDFGYTLGPNEQAMLDFAVASGTVGDKFRPAADKMVLAIDALVERMDKFLKRFEEVLPAAADAAHGIQNTLGSMKIPPVEIPFRPRWDEGYTPGGGSAPPGAPGSTMTVPALASGGIVRRPTIALVGEKGPEAVVPLPGDIGGDVTTTIYLDGDVIARSTTKRQPNVLRAYGVMR